MIFALTAVVALAGVMFAGVGFAAADAPFFLTLKAAERVDMDIYGHVCNENYGGAGENCAVCHDRALNPNGYASDHLFCTNSAYTDCGFNGGNPGPGYDFNHQACYGDDN